MCYDSTNQIVPCRSTLVQALEKHNQKERDPAGCNGSALLCLQSAIAARCLLLHAASQHATG
jgi:hypothetical protein